MIDDSRVLILYSLFNGRKKMSRWDEILSSEKRLMVKGRRLVIVQPI